MRIDGFTGRKQNIDVRYEFNFKIRGFIVQIEIIADIFDRFSKQRVNLLLFLSNRYCLKLVLIDLPGHDGKVTTGK